ncbi:MAG: Ig-like domain-containing protein [Bacteroidales bacterium]|jgi:uncharacterized protein (TIGR02145 family)|nr:Ig-like domain-containing protein [Bacteroidales bacterium]
MKKIVYAAIILSLICFISCEKEQSARVSRIVVEQSPVAFIGDTMQLHVRFFPDNATNTKMRWESSDESIATVDEFGRVIGFITDTVRLKVTTEDGGHTATCLLTVRSANRCNADVPNFGESLGPVSFASDKVWRMERQYRGRWLRQEWSDVVRASNCDKSTFHGGYAPTATLQGNYNADCRSNPNDPDGGHLFSWCAVARYEEQLCPEGWRVPTREDFTTLDTILYGTGANVTPQNYESVNTLVENYFSKEDNPNSWGANYTGYADRSDTVVNPTATAVYWAITESNINAGADLSLLRRTDAVSGQITTANVAPQHWADKRNGMAVRCVRNY